MSEYPIKNAQAIASVKVRDIDVDSFLTESYGKEYECVPVMEWNNGEDHEREIRPNPLDDHYQAQLDKWLADPMGYGAPPVWNLLNALCAQGKIPAGSLTIKVSW